MTVILALAAGVTSGWSVSGLILSFTKGRLDVPFVRAVWAELRPFYLPAVAVRIIPIIMSGSVLGWNTFTIACYVLNWFLFKDISDDDRWKRRKAKLVEKVQRQGARLVVVPAGDRS